MSAKDDVMPTANEEPWDIVTGAEAHVIGGATQEMTCLHTLTLTSQV